MSISFLLSFLVLAVGFLLPRQVKAHDPGKAAFTNKVIPDIIGCEAEIALSYFPALESASIEFRFKKDIKKSMMQAQPRGLFKGKGRYYIINISERFFVDQQTEAISGVPSDVLIGWLVHELGHIMDYHERSSMGLVVFGFKYLTSKKYLRDAEKAADTYAVDHGCGDYLIQCKEFILGHDDLPEAYKARIRNSYLCPETIKSMIEQREMVDIEEPVGPGI